MSSEINIGYFFPELSKYLRETYKTADPKAVDLLITQKEAEKKEYEIHPDRKFYPEWEFDPLTSLKTDAFETAIHAGISEKLLTTLAAVQKMETKLPNDKRELTPKKYLELLVSAELTTAHNRSNPWTKPNYEEARFHTQKASKLLEFLKDFE